MMNRTLPPRTNLAATAYGPRRRELAIGIAMLALLITTGIVVFIARGSTLTIIATITIAGILELALAYLAFYRQEAYWPIEKWLLQSLKWRRRGRRWVRGGAYRRGEPDVAQAQPAAAEERTTAEPAWLLSLLRFSPMISLCILAIWTALLAWIGDEGVREAQFTLKALFGF